MTFPNLNGTMSCDIQTVTHFSHADDWAASVVNCNDGLQDRSSLVPEITLTPVDDDEVNQGCADDRMFGTHLMHAIQTLRGK